MVDRALSRRSLGSVLLLALAVLGGARVAQGAIYQAYGFNARELLINAGAFGVLAATCSALVVDRGVSRITRWGAFGGVVWVAAAAVGVWLAAGRDAGWLTIADWNTGEFGGRVFYADTAVVGALSALGTSASVLGDSTRALRRRVVVCSGLVLVAATVAAVMGQGVRAP
jgi:hypothetical protein